MRWVSLITTLIIVNSVVVGQDLKEFRALLDDCGMSAEIPSDFIECAINENQDMSYDYAIKYEDKDFELRYAIRPIQYKRYSNDTIKAEVESQIPFRNASYEIILNTIILNITGGVEPNIHVFDPEDVEREFNAQWGATAFVELNSEFGKGFK